MKKIRNLLMVLAAGLLLGACSTPQLGYFQDLESGQVFQMQNVPAIKIEPGDKLSIFVNSKNPELAYLFNLNIVGRYNSSSSNETLRTNQISSYTVDENGDIDFPILGKMHIAGMNRAEVSDFVKQRLIEGQHLKDATVTVNFLDLYFEVMGEVSHPGRFQIDHDHITLIDALSRSGDLTIYGKRDNVLLIRDEGGQQKIFRVDLRNAKELYSSPAYYIKQNDIVYVEPNSTKANQSTVNGNTLRTPTFWMSVTSLISSLCVIIFK